MQEHLSKASRRISTPAILAEIDKRSDELAAASPAGHLRFLQAPGSAAARLRRQRSFPPTEMLWLKRDIPAGLSGRRARESGHRPRRSRQRRSRCSERLALVHWMAMMIHTARSTARQARNRAGVRIGAWIAARAAKRDHSGTFRMVTLSDIQQAQQRLRGVAVRTPLIAYFPPAGNDRHGPRPALVQAREPAADRRLQDSAALTTRLHRSPTKNAGAASSPTPAATTPRASLTRHVRWESKAVIVMPRNAPRLKWRAPRRSAPRS